ncbi:RabGAP/TBC [Tothia fuscella]|uniref:RabGAP/TBC n=1 Tax=Tothia fuscella TaxID=1048955 RepID=A0A9P4U135_9PEZI|nr:RabGAP/TBC [Tothia fuscella]
MRELASALSAWNELSKYSDLADFKKAISESEDELEAVTGLRSLCWKIFLLFQNLDQTTWSGSLDNSRSAYSSLRSHYLRAIEHPDEVSTSADPLSTDDESPWTALRADEALRAEIYQDVQRCMPENIYFRQPETQQMMLDVLFVYCKLNPDVGYRQGMHELLAPILWVVERDAIDAGKDGERKGKEGEGEDAGIEVLKTVLDGSFVEHDTFTLIGIIMQTAKGFYDPATEAAIGTSRGRAGESESAILMRCRRIFHTLLPQVDPALATHLEALDISPQIFLMRWIRLILGREFPFDDLLRVWDLLFAEDSSIELIDHICVAMLLRIRWQLMDADVNEALMLLMRYPSPASTNGPHTFVHDAIYLKANMDIDGGIHIVTRYSNRAPPRIMLERPKTPEQPPRSETPDPRRTNSPFNSPAAAASSVENALHDAARGVLNRGERWGINQALRDTIGEVRKNVQTTLNSGRNSPRTGSMTGIRPLHRTTRSDVSSNIAANVLRKVGQLEERNKQLAKMLEGAVAELWKFEKDANEKMEGNGEDKSKDDLQALSMAVAKVQFVQVFLQDSTLPLPAEETETKPPDVLREENVNDAMSEQKALHAPEPEPEPAPLLLEEPHPQPLRSQASPTVIPTPASITPTLTKTPSIPIPTILRPSSTQPQSSPHNRALPTIFLSQEHASSLPPSNLSSKPSNLGTVPSANLPTRPKIEQSSFSWMLGQAHEDRSGFVTASPFSPHERRWNAAHGGTEKGFLFGEEDDVVGDPPKVKVREEDGKGKSGKKDAGGAGRKGSLKGAGVREDIGLGDMGGEG